MAKIIPESRHEEFVRLWGDMTASGGYLREYFGVSWESMEATRIHLGLQTRPNKTHQCWEPGPEEIESRAAEARAKWGVHRELGRQSSVSRQRAEVKTYNYDRRTGIFT